MNDKDRIINSHSVKEEVNISSYPLTECNDVTNHSVINRLRPKVWAQTRQELCETLNYFRTYQSGVYHKDNVVYSYLMDAFGAKRDVCNGRVIISHGGGKSSKQNNGRYGLFESQLTTDASVSSLLNNFVDKQPVIIIVGNKCSIAKFQVPARYCVLGMYLITHAWPEYEVVNGLEEKDDDDDLTDEEVLIENSLLVKPKIKKRKSVVKHFIRWKFRFEWMTNQEFEPWWETPVEMMMMNSLMIDTPDYDICLACGDSSIQIYDIWICLNHLCKLFWKVWNSNKRNWELASQNLNYKQTFLNPGFVPKELLMKPLPFSIIPPLIPTAQVGFDTYTSLQWKGYHCRRCGRVSCRIKWNGWECFNCHKMQPAPRLIIDKSMLVDPYRPIFTGPATDCDGSILEGSDIFRKRTVLSDGEILMEYKFPEGGHVFHYVSNEKTNKMPDTFLKEFQKIDCENLKRHPVKQLTNRVGSCLFSRQFTLNIGAHYKQALDLDTVPWSSSPKVCKDSFVYMQNIVRNFVVPKANFNQMLTAIYMEGQKMSWHDDGDKGVGPVIATLSLGSSAEMRFRRKVKKDEHKLVNESESTKQNVENTRLETTEREVETSSTCLDYNRKRKLMNNESTFQENQDNTNANGNNVSKKGRRKRFSRNVMVGSKIKPQVEQEAESAMNVVQLPPIRNLTTPDEDKLPEFSSIVSNLEESTNRSSYLPIDISKVYIKRRISGPELSLILHHGDLIVMNGQVLQDNYDHMVIPKGFRIVSTIRYIEQQ